MEYRSRVASRRVGTSECRFSVRARGATTRSYPNKQRCVFPVLYNTWNESRLTEARLRTAHSDDRQLARLRCRPARHRDGEDAVRVVRGDVSQTCVPRQPDATAELEAARVRLGLASDREDGVFTDRHVEVLRLDTGRGDVSRVAVLGLAQLHVARVA